MKIIYNIAGLYRPAGMERVLVNKANWLAEYGYDVLVVTTEQGNRPLCFPLDRRVRLVNIDINYEENNGKSLINKALRYPAKKIRHYRQLKGIINQEKPDIVVSMFCNDASFIPRISGGARTILEVHFSRFKRLQYNRKGLWRVVDRIRSKHDLSIARSYDSFVVLTEEDRELWGGLKNILVISNARTFKVEEPASLDSKTVLAVGRYCAQKSFDRLIEAWREVAKEHKSWKLRLVGDGEDYELLESMIVDYSLQDSVILGPASDNMIDIYKNASIMVSCSRYEGLPMVLLEAQAVGLPIIAFACKCGPRDIISNGVDGFLIEEGDIVSLSNAMKMLIKDDELRRSMGRAAFCASDRYDENFIMQKWISLFTKQ